MTTATRLDSTLDHYYNRLHVYARICICIYHHVHIYIYACMHNACVCIYIYIYRPPRVRIYVSSLDCVYTNWLYLVWRFCNDDRWSRTMSTEFLWSAKHIWRLHRVAKHWPTRTMRSNGTDRKTALQGSYNIRPYIIGSYILCGHDDRFNARRVRDVQMYTLLYTTSCCRHK